MLITQVKKIHFVGIGGVGMSGIAEVLINLDILVSGSDIYENDYVQHLKDIGAEIYIGHSKDNLKNVDVVVKSTAVKDSNIEIKTAKKLNIPVIPRVEMLAELMRLKYSVAVAGSHGKTTTTSLISLLLSAGKLDPTIVIGGRFNNIGSGAKLGKSDLLVAEADESDGSFLKLFPIITVITNVDNDHLDYYKTVSKIKKAFIEFANKVPFYGNVVICNEGSNCREIIKKINKKVITYGFTKESDVYATNIKFRDFRSSFDLYYFKSKIGNIKLNVPGKHNILNVLAAITVSQEFNIDIDTIKNTLNQYKGVQRRFQIKGEVDNIFVIDDYAHHPTEIFRTLESAKLGCKRKLLCIFQPHRYTRTKLLYKEFGKAFFNADELIITDIYPASEKPIKGVTSELIIKSLEKNGYKNVKHISDHDEIVEYVFSNLKNNMTIMTLGAGHIWRVAETIAKRLLKMKGKKSDHKDTKAQGTQSN